MGSKKAPEYAKTTTDTGLFGKATTSKKGSTYSPTDFQRQLVGITENNAGNFLNNYLNPNYESDEYKQGDAYYTNKMNNMLENNYINPLLSRNLLRGSTASDAMRGFANDLANNEYERQQDYRNQQLQNYQAAMLPYATIYDMMTGTQGLSNQLSNNVSNYNAEVYKAQQAANATKYAATAQALGNIGASAT
ncbi:MAG: hypothetical protein MJ180_00195 [Candidatus Gastranaerophilales bacterium]|nr:hypothetical protein [Candidatus Gastranaerophilales bacterium]